MSSPRWVQHVSGQGEKWQLVGDHEHSQKFCWVVWNHNDKIHRNTFHLPQSDYHLCGPPERWVDVTERYTEENVQLAWMSLGHRLRKVQLYPLDYSKGVCGTTWAFIVEKREP